MEKKKIIPQYEPLFGFDEAKAVYKYMVRGGWLTEHEETRTFENKVAKFLGVEYCSAVNNGTISLSLALLALGVKTGDRVIVPSLSMIATANAVRFIGAKPIFVDVEEKTLCMDIDKTIELAKLYEVKAIIYVSLNGRRTCTGQLKFYCKTHNIGFLEDAAQAFGSSHSCNKMIGNLADITSFSLSPHKIISTGQGGLLVTNDGKLAEKIHRLKDFGRDLGGNDIHEHFGINSKFTDIQAVIGMRQLNQIHYRMEYKKELYLLYESLLKDVKEVQFIPTNTLHTVPWFIDIYVEDREALAYWLKSCGVITRNLYPPIHKQKCYGISTQTLPVTEKYSKMGLWLPSSFNLERKDVEYVCKKIGEFYSAK